MGNFVDQAKSCKIEVELVEARLAVLSERIADELVKPIEMRNTASIAATLDNIEKQRPRLRRAARNLGSALVALNKRESTASSRAGLKSSDRIAMRRLLAGINYRLRQWRSVISVVEEQVSGNKRPLYRQSRSKYEAIDVQLAISDDVFLKLHDVANPAEQHPLAKEHGCYPDIRLKPSEFVGHAHAAYRILLAQRRKAPIRFLDVGCGGGVKVLLASRFFDYADGLEFDPSYAQVARDLFEVTRAASCCLVEGDALTFERYQDYDVVYFFQPMSNTEKLLELEERIARNVRPGTLLIAPYLKFLNRSGELGCPRISGSVHIAGVDYPMVEKLRRAAEASGNAVVRDGNEETALGFWRTITKASRANGFEPLK